MATNKIGGRVWAVVVGCGLLALLLARYPINRDGRGLGAGKQGAAGGAGPETRPFPTTQTFRPRLAADNYPRVQINFLARAADGKLWPRMVGSVELVSDDTKSDCLYPIHATGLRIGVGPRALPDDPRQIVEGEKYFLRSVDFKQTGPFEVPAVKPGEVKTIDLVVLPPEPPVVPGPPPLSFSGTVTDLAALGPVQKRVAAWQAGYDVGGNFYGCRLSPHGEFQFSGPPLGGELAIGTPNFNFSMFYVRKMNSKKIRLPLEATYTYSARNIVNITVESDELKDKDGTALAAYVGSDCQIPIAWAGYDGSGKPAKIALPKGMKLWLRMVRAPKPPVELGVVTVLAAGGTVDLGPTTRP